MTLKLLATHCVKVFVYGTLKPGESNYQRYCQGKIIEALPAITWGQLFELPSRGYPAMTPGNERVHGVVLTFTDPALLATLDQLEDYEPQRSPSENEYQRRLSETYTPHQQPLGPAWAYFMTPERVAALGGIYIPEGCWKG